MKKEIKIARLDLSNKALVEKLREVGIRMTGSDDIMVVKEGKNYNYDGTWHDVKALIHYMQRVANPLVNLKSVKEIINFIEDASEHYMFDPDFEAGLL